MKEEEKVAEIALVPAENSIKVAEIEITSLEPLEKLVGLVDYIIKKHRNFLLSRRKQKIQSSAGGVG